MAPELAVLAPLAADPRLLAAAVALDLAFGDPQYAAHPVRLMGGLLRRVERRLRARGRDGYAGGIVLFLALGGVFTSGAAGIVLAAAALHPLAGASAHLLLLYSLLALGDLLRHGAAVEDALRAGDLAGARIAVSRLVGRDTDRMDEAACRRAVIESLSENLTDGFVTPLVWYAIAGLPGLVLFKVVSTMDSMVGYKTPEYIRFGWCGARLDDVLNYVPARLTWLLVAVAAAMLPGASARGAWHVGLHQHGVLPSPNSGWSEAAVAGALRRRLVGPIWMSGRLVTDVWIGDPSDSPAAAAEDYRRARGLVVVTGMLATAVAIAAIAVR